MNQETALDFSVIIPTYNRPRELSCCLESLAALDFPKDRFEVIVVDDGSDFPVTPVVSRFSNRLNIISIHEVNGGPGQARNTGAEAASGKFLAFTDDDCVAAPDWLSAFMEMLSAEPGVAVGGKTVNAVCDNPYSTASQIIVDLVYEHYNAQTREATFFATNNLALSAEQFRMLGGFDTSFRTSEDRDLCDRWTAAGYRMCFVPGAIIYHSHELSFGKFWVQHLNYGRGARRFYVAHQLRGSSSSTLKVDFHLSLPKRLPLALRDKPRPWSLVGLMAVWQLANFFGFALETLFPRQTPSPEPQKEK